MLVSKLETAIEDGCKGVGEVFLCLPALISACLAYTHSGSFWYGFSPGTGAGMASDTRANPYAQHPTKYCFLCPHTRPTSLHTLAHPHLDVLSSPLQLTLQFSRWLKERKELVKAHTHAWDLRCSAGGRQDATVYKHTNTEPPGGFYQPHSKHTDRVIDDAGLGAEDGEDDDDDDDDDDGYAEL
ncbi:hypothetical protein DFJ58DRAFT_843894 [Suillus subalutaceus]|uniref:uncharacterized protein n=1 Tax=Suillus subalutaceus TaxID=48586 RepID=UPI001B865FB8|nr:uncharacterized protein DFJ58DRAFT_843894 [Suillus subalutaceus]KAG1844964.1 hypothetical protein DFJ58DRAFT_843894 [Suillus subalutaceus]